MHEEAEFWTTKKRPRIGGPMRYKLPDDLSKQHHRIHLIIHTRDPRDVLVSMYYSFGWTHTAPEGKEKEFAEFQQGVRNMTVDQFALESVDDQVQWLTYLISLLEHPPTRQPFVLISTYQRMVENFSAWNRNVCQFLHIGYNQTMALEQLFIEDMQRTRQRMIKPLDVTTEYNSSYSHVRDGSSGQYNRKLKPETIDRLNSVLESLLHDYELLAGGFPFA